MNDGFVQLPWDVLWRAEGDIPWSAMGVFAEALASQPDLIDPLFNAYDEAREAVHERTCYVHLYVPAIFALAAPKLDDRRRQEIGESLIARLVEASERDDHLMMEVLVAACGAMGPAILPLVFGVVIDETASSSAWGQLWGLTKLAVGSDAALRDAVVAACVWDFENARAPHSLFLGLASAESGRTRGAARPGTDQGDISRRLREGPPRWRSISQTRLISSLDERAR